MALLQPKLNLKVAQRQVLTPGLMQMVSVLALNKLELKEMIDAEMVENPVLEEIDESVPMLDEVASREERLERSAEDRLDRSAQEAAAPPKDIFNEIDFGSYFQEYLDPGYRTQPEYEESERPSFENFLSQPTTLSDHLAWQLGSLSLDVNLHAAADFVIGNLDGEGYLGATAEELAVAFEGEPTGQTGQDNQAGENQYVIESIHASENGLAAPFTSATTPVIPSDASIDLIRRAIDLVQHLDPAGVGARDLRESLMLQIAAQQQEFEQLYGAPLPEPVEADPHGPNPHGSLSDEADRRIEERRRAMQVAAVICDRHLHLLQKRDMKELARAVQVPPHLKRYQF